MDSTYDQSPYPLRKTRSFGTSYDATVLPTVVCVAIGSITGVHAVAVSGPEDLNDLAAMVAFP
jgi:hypothetical protein